MKIDNALEKLLSVAHRGEMTFGALEDFCSATNTDIQAAYDLLSRHFAEAFLAGTADFDECDRPINSLFAIMADRSISEFAFNVYLAFDAGEFHHKTDRPEEIPSIKYTIPMLRNVLGGASSNTYRHPRKGTAGRLIGAAANSKFLASVRRAVLSRLPFVKLESDVTDVVYITWLVPVAACQHFIPPGLRVWQKNGLTPFTILTYKHAHFGPGFLGPIRKLFPSPLQSNWRFYLENAPQGAPRVSTVLFLKNVMNSLAYTLGTRMFSDAMPTHLADQFVHRREGSVVTTLITSGGGSAPSLACSVRVCHEHSLSTDFESTFGTWREAVQFLAFQDAAVTPVESCSGLAFAEIDLPIDVSQILPAAPTGNQVACPLLNELQPKGEPFCFVVPSVRFRVISERLL